MKLSLPADKASFPLQRAGLCLAVAALLVLASAAQGSDQPLVGTSQNMLGIGEDLIGDVQFGFGADYDIHRVKGSVAGNRLLLEFSVVGNQPALPDFGLPGELVPRFGIDTDQNPNTGIPTVGDGIGLSSNGIGVDYAVDFINYDPQNRSAPVFDSNGQFTGTASAYIVNSIGDVGPDPELFFLVEIPLSALGNDDGRVNFAVANGDVSAFADAAPNLGFVTSVLESEILLHGGRFLVTLDWTDFFGNSGPALPFLQSDESVMLYFFNPSNWEMLVKVLDGCGFPGAPFFWVFAGGPTDVQYRLEVTDLLVGVTQVYENPLGNAAPAIRDTSAFATCGGSNL